MADIPVTVMRSYYEGAYGSGKFSFERNGREQRPEREAPAGAGQALWAVLGRCGCGQGMSAVGQVSSPPYQPREIF